MEWLLKEQAPKWFLEQFPEFDSLILNLLWQRDLRTQELIDKFFNPDYEHDLHDPFLLSGMEVAVERIVRSIHQHEKVAIFGDYDVDGISGSAMLATVLAQVGLDFKIYIPNRATDGYGMNLPAVEEAARWGAKLLVVVDCGITDFEEVQRAKELGVAVIIIDHHQPLERLPEALVILNPHLPGGRYPFKDLVATGLTFKLTQALLARLRQVGFALQEGFEKWFLDLVALATVADVAPLLGENRTLCKYGLAVLANTSRVGLRELMSVARIKPSTIPESSWQVELYSNGNNNGRRVRKHPLTNLNTQAISFALANRINAASRMAHADVSFKLLMSSSKSEAQKLALELEKKAKERMRLVKKIIEEFEATYEVMKNDPFIFAGSANWPIGVLGPVANQLLEKYHKPTFIFERRDEESLGSVRAEKNINVVEVLSNCQKHLVEYGGHPQSAGFRFKTECLEQLRQCLSKTIPRSVDHQTHPLEIDAIITLKDISMKLFQTLQAFEPFGMGNPFPKFLIRNVKIAERRAIGAEKQHSKLVLTDEENLGFSVKALAFNKDLPEHLESGARVDVVAEMLSDEFHGVLSLSLKIVDIRLSQTIPELSHLKIGNQL